MKLPLFSIALILFSLIALAPPPADEISAQAIVRYPELGKSGSPFNREFLRRAKIYTAENPQFTSDKTWILRLADEVATVIDTYAPFPEIEFKVLLVIKRFSDAYHPLFLPVRSEMSEEDIAKARHCFEIQTPDMVHEATHGRVKFTPTVIVSDQPLRCFNPKRRDSAEYAAEELQNELATLTKPGDYDTAGYYFLYYDNASGYRIPRAGYGVGGFNSALGIGTFAVGSTSQMNPRDEIYIHEWIHGLEGFYGNKTGVRLAKGGLHGTANYDGRYSLTKPWRQQDTFRGYMEWIKDLLNAKIPDGEGFVGLGDPAWRHGPMRKAVPQKESYAPTVVPSGSYPEWVYELMLGNLTNAKLGSSLLPEGLHPGEIAKETMPWRLDVWNPNAKTTAQYLEADGGMFTLECPVGNHASIRCDVQLEPFSNYVFSAEVKTTGIKIQQEGGKYSALISAEASRSTKDLSGSVDWTPIVLPFTTKGDQPATTLRLQVGGQSSLTTGRAVFRKLKLQKVDYPEGAVTP